MILYDSPRGTINDGVSGHNVMETFIITGGSYCRFQSGRAEPRWIDMMHKPSTAPLFAAMLLLTLCMVLPSSTAQTWGGDENLSVLVEVDGAPIGPNNQTIPVSDVMELTLCIRANVLLTLQSITFRLSYLGIPMMNQPNEFDILLPAGYNSTQDIPVDLSTLSLDGISLISGTVEGSLAFVYNVTPYENNTIVQRFKIAMGSGNPLYSVPGIITVGLTAMTAISLLLALAQFQGGIFAAARIRQATRARDVKVFPKQTVLGRKRRRRKEDQEIPADLSERATEIAQDAWDGRYCPKCGKRWKRGAPTCAKCGLDMESARRLFAERVGKLAPAALEVIRPGTRMTVGELSKKLRVRAEIGGAIAAALLEMNLLRTRSVRVPLKKITFSGSTIVGLYLSWSQLLGGTTPSWIYVLLLTAGALVATVTFAYCLRWLARVPRFGYGE